MEREREKQTLLSLLFQEDTMISIWTGRKTAASTKPDRKVEVSIGADGGGGGISVNIEEEELLCVCFVCVCVCVRSVAPPPSRSDRCVPEQCVIEASHTCDTRTCWRRHQSHTQRPTGQEAS